MESGHTILSALLYVSGVFYPTTGQYWEKAVLCISGLGFFVLWTTYMNSTLSYLHGVGVSAHGNSVVAFSLPLPFVFFKGGAGESNPESCMLGKPCPTE